MVSSALFTQNFIAVSSVLVKRDEFQTVGGFDLRFPGVEDYHLWLRISQKSPIVSLADPLVIYRIHSGAMSDAPQQTSITGAVLEDVLTQFPSMWTDCGNATVKERLWKIHWKAAYTYWMHE
jgi:hypothetical protein